GSALLPAPAGDMSLDDEITVTNLLLRSGATIQEVNTVRKHLSRIKGGRLAAAASPAGVVALVLSDVLGDPIDAIASGPTAPDLTTFGEALEIIRRYGLAASMPVAAMTYLQRGAAGREPETPKPDDPVLGESRPCWWGVTSKPSRPRRRGRKRWDSAPSFSRRIWKVRRVKWRAYFAVWCAESAPGACRSRLPPVCSPAVRRPSPCADRGVADASRR